MPRNSPSLDMRAPRSRPAPTIRQHWQRRLRDRLGRAGLPNRNGRHDHTLALNSSSRLALSLGATLLAHDGQTSRAVEYRERALQLSRHDPTAYLELTTLGIAHLAAGNFKEAVAVCNKACKSNPHFSFLVALQAAALFKLGRVDEQKRCRGVS